MSDVLNLYQKLAKIRKQVEVVQKNKSGYGYKYVTDDELLAKITVGMDKYGVSLIPNIVPNTLLVEPYTYKKTKREKQKDGSYATYEENVNEFTAVCDMEYIWVNNDNPDETIKEIFENIKFIVEIVEDNHLWMFFKQLHKSYLSGII